MNMDAKGLGLLNILISVVLFAVKLAAGLLSNSIGVISDALNSLMDALSAVLVYISVRVSGEKADSGHPFGHYRAQPIAALFIAMLAALFAVELFRFALERLIAGAPPVELTAFTFGALLFSMAVKLGEYALFRRKGRASDHTAFRAVAVDARNDLLATGVVLVSLVGVGMGYDYLDSMAAIVIGIVILHSGWKVARENIDYLMGAAPPETLMQKIKAAARSVEGVKGINSCRAHYVGTRVNVEIHIEVKLSTPTQDSHDIGKQVQWGIEGMDGVNRCFVHIDPV